MSGAQAGVHFHGTPAKLVEAAGQMLRSFRNGLDYAFILAREDAGRVIRAKTRILVPAHLRSAGL